MSKLHADSITQSFGTRKILQDVFMSCETGKISGILGPSGGGKSTLMQIIFGTVKGDTQFIKYNETVLKNLSDRRNRIAYLPQRASFLPKNTRIHYLISLFCNKENKARLCELELMKPFLEETVSHLSGGEKRIVETLLILYSEADFILLDEPFSGVSPKICDEMETLIKRESSSKGIIISDHNYEPVVRMADDIYLLSDTYLRKIKDFEELRSFNYLPKSI
jgi:lipopolysaccharide export system ATP-binding protein